MSLGTSMLREVEDATRRMALALGVVGLINIQFAVVGEELYVIEANPRASRTVPFVSKAVGLPMAKLATRVMLGERLADMTDELVVDSDHEHVSVKAAVLPFGRFPQADAVLGPEMKSTGEVMGIARDFPAAFGRAQEAAGATLPESGKVFISVAGADKAAATQLAASLHDLGFAICATGGTAAAIRRMGVPVERILQLSEGSPNVLDLIRSGEVDLVINTPTGSGARKDGWAIRRAAIRRGIPVITTMTGASAAQRAILAAHRDPAPLRSLQQLHARQRELSLT
jgi:carbamoyl-phosphate synthase large subunit